MLNLLPVRLRRRESVSLGRFRNCNQPGMNNFRRHGVEDEPDPGKSSPPLPADDMPAHTVRFPGTCESPLRDPARIPSHWLRVLWGAGPRAGGVPTHRDACRACSKARPEETGRGRLRVCATSVAEKLFLRGL